MEVFKRIIGFDNKYYIGNLGTVKNKNGLIIKPQIKRYPFVQLTKNKTQKAFFINTLLKLNFNDQENKNSKRFKPDTDRIEFDKFSFFQQFNDTKRRNYSDEEIIFELEIKRRKIT